MLKHIILQELFLSLNITLITLRISYFVYIQVVLDNIRINKYFNEKKTNIETFVFYDK